MSFCNCLVMASERLFWFLLSSWLALLLWLPKHPMTHHERDTRGSPSSLFPSTSVGSLLFSLQRNITTILLPRARTARGYKHYRHALFISCANMTFDISNTLSLPRFAEIQLRFYVYLLRGSFLRSGRLSVTRYLIYHRRAYTRALSFYRRLSSLSPARSLAHSLPLSLSLSHFSTRRLSLRRSVSSHDLILLIFLRSSLALPSFSYLRFVHQLCTRIS